ncbi:MAG: fimbrillin family protein [Alistipes sp.]|nr:fimbrillin family protein [Alistipes sp.]
MLRNSLFVIAFCGLLASCSTKQELESRETDGVIRLGVAKMTRAEVQSATDLGNNIGIYGVQLPNKTASGWGNALSMDNVRSSRVEASGAIVWDGIYYYPIDPAHYVKFCAYYPYADGTKFMIDAPATGKAPSLRFTLNGTDDILYATPVVGRYGENPDPMVFNHALTQLKFEIQDINAALTDRVVENIVIQNANTASSMNVETGVFGTWSAPAELKVPGVEGKNITLVDKNSLAVGDGIMLQPGLESFKIRLELAGHSYPDVEIKPTGELTFAAGHSYKITLTFNEKIEVNAKVVVIPWELAGTGSAVIQ